jgi:small subunit ribosomal protein S1
VSIDPRELDSPDIRSEMESALGGMTPDELERAADVRKPRQRAQESGRITGTIVSVRGEDVFVDIGGKAEAFVPREEFDNEHPPEPGQSRTFIAQGFDSESGLMRLSLREARVEADLESLSVGDVVEMRVTGVNIGGLELTSGGLRAFMPKSQVELDRIEDFSRYVNHKLECQITEIDRRGRGLVVSRRRVLERQREEQRQQLKYSLAEGQVRKGIVRRLTDFGAFVDLGGLDGLLHIGDISYGRVAKASDVLKPGDEVEVKVLKIDLVKDRISLGMKQLAPDPWQLVAANYRAGATVDGRVMRLMDFGAFIELEPGVEGLLPVGEISWTQRIRHPREVLKEGDAVRVQIMTVDIDHRRISLSLKALGTDPWQGIGDRYAPDALVSGRVARIADFGAFIQLEEGVEGLAHISELSDRRVKTVAEVVKVGDVVQVRIKSIDTDQRRISLSMKGIGRPGEEPPAGQVSAAGPIGEHAPPAPTAVPPPKPKRKKALRGGLTY